MATVITSSPIMRRDKRLEQIRRRSQSKYTFSMYSRDLRVSQNPKADANYVWENLESQAETPQSFQFQDPSRKAREFYNVELRPILEAQNNGQYVAIHPETYDYVVELRPGKAFLELRKRQPHGPIIVHNIGVANSGLRARLRGEQPR